MTWIRMTSNGRTKSFVPRRKHEKRLSSCGLYRGGDCRSCGVDVATYFQSSGQGAGVAGAPHAGREAAENHNCGMDYVRFRVAFPGRSCPAVVAGKSLMASCLHVAADMIPRDVAARKVHHV